MNEMLRYTIIRVILFVMGGFLVLEKVQTGC